MNNPAHQYIYLNNIQIPQDNVVNNLALHLGNKLTWREYIVKKKEQILLKLKKNVLVNGQTVQIDC